MKDECQIRATKTFTKNLKKLYPNDKNMVSRITKLSKIIEEMLK